MERCPATANIRISVISAAPELDADGMLCGGWEDRDAAADRELTAPAGHVGRV